MSRSPAEQTIAQAKACVLCAPHLAHGPRPVFRVSAHARVLLVGQAPGAKVHESGEPWLDASGDHLLEWLEVDRAAFDDGRSFAILPMGFCWPGRRAGGDLPPRRECAPKWHASMVSLMPQVKLRLLVGQYAQAWYLGARAKPTLTQTVRAFREYLPSTMPLPHPSWRSRLWMKKHPWFEEELLPVLRASVRSALGLSGNRRCP